MDELDNILKRVVKKGAPISGPEEGCISEEMFASYMENALSPAEKEKVQTHLVACASCHEKSIVFSSVIHGPGAQQSEEVPQNIAAKTKTLLNQELPGDLVEVVLEFGRNIINIISDAAGICTISEPAALSARSPHNTDSQVPAMHLSREMSGAATSISIEKTDEAACEIQAKLSDTDSGDLLNDIRVSLLSGGRELASFLTVNGSASFRNLPIDTYLLKVQQGGNQPGSLLLKLSSK